jgi:hypothetical protein
VGSRACGAGLVAFGAGTVLQVAMVLIGHLSPVVASWFAVLGITLSAIAGALYAALARPGTRRVAVLGGTLVGGGCALIGIAISLYLGDVTVAVLGFGTVSSALTGALGGWLGRGLFRAREM